MKLCKKFFTAILLAVASVVTAHAQDAAIKTNIFYDATASINLGFEVGVGRQLTLDVNGDMNFWNVGPRRWRHWFVQPELRYWFCHRSLGHFMAVQLHSGQYNIGNLQTKGFKFLGTDYRNLSDRRYEGWFAGAGIAYGYAWAFSEHWGMEAEIGLGWAYSRYSAYPCAECGSRIVSNADHNYVGLTKLALNLVYNF